MTQRTIYLIRHGQYENASAPGEEPDGPLTELGREQATLTGRRLAELPIRAIHHSTSRRAVETAAMIGRAIPGPNLHPTPLLREAIPCIPPLDNLPEATRNFFAQIPRDFIEASGARVQQAFETYFVEPAGEEETQELLVAHGNIIGYFLCRALGAPAESWIRADMRHCGVSEVIIRSGGRMRVNAHGDTGHLPLALRTFV
jgi:broad specificity phosphatase PhoE